MKINNDHYVYVDGIDLCNLYLIVFAIDKNSLPSIYFYTNEFTTDLCTFFGLCIS